MNPIPEEVILQKGYIMLRPFSLVFPHLFEAFSCSFESEGTRMACAREDTGSLRCVGQGLHSEGSCIWAIA